MADRTPGTAKFPAGKSADRDDSKPRKTMDVTPPAFGSDSSKSAAERFLNQQWRDVAANGTAKNHPLSINRDSGNVSNDAYSA